MRSVALARRSASTASRSSIARTAMMIASIGAPVSASSWMRPAMLIDRPHLTVSARPPPAPIGICPTLQGRRCTCGVVPSYGKRVGVLKRGGASMPRGAADAAVKTKPKCHYPRHPTSHTTASARSVISLQRSGRNWNLGFNRANSYEICRTSCRFRDHERRASDGRAPQMQ
ncbi:exported hypothetical protein [uncultured Pleomorphomonas sp.]|uniref:Uncharacterized protein n=1 Tax=uncultured Pleomorphomonas sp. TaxID=442121 RepID=A0A212LD29_9HYPH|nr:exported hypothetical protein [uncultured Pleomorphomonas sp.]